MPSSFFFQNLGLFVREGFFNSATCTQIQSQMRLGEAVKGLIGGAEPEIGILDEDVRKVLSVHVEVSSENLVLDAVRDLKPSLEEHFQVPLREFEFPTFLRYGEGAFYRPHKDGTPETPTATKDRRVSVVIFLNSRSEEPSPDSYGGGALTFYGLLDGPMWEKCPFPLDANPGLLIAFRSDVLHEVRPVTFGQRFTIVTWFRI
jgi:SM-20-related protein